MLAAFAGKFDIIYIKNTNVRCLPNNTFFIVDENGIKQWDARFGGSTHKDRYSYK